MPWSPPATCEGGTHCLGVSAWDPDTKIFSGVWNAFLCSFQINPCTAINVLAQALRMGLVCRGVGKFYGLDLVYASLVLLASEWESDGAQLDSLKRRDFLVQLGLQDQAARMKCVTATCIMEIGSKGEDVQVNGKGKRCLQVFGNWLCFMSNPSALDAGDGSKFCCCQPSKIVNAYTIIYHLMGIP